MLHLLLTLLFRSESVKAGICTTVCFWCCCDFHLIFLLLSTRKWRLILLLRAVHHNNIAFLLMPSAERLRFTPKIKESDLPLQFTFLNLLWAPHLITNRIGLLMCAQLIPHPQGPWRNENVEVVIWGLVDPPLCLDWGISRQTLLLCCGLLCSLCVLFCDPVQQFTLLLGGRRCSGVRGWERTISSWCRHCPEATQSSTQSWIVSVSVW